MATAKKTAAPKTVKSVTRTLTTAKNTAAVPAVLAKAGKQFGADAAGVPGSKKPTKAPKDKRTEIIDSLTSKGIKPKMLGKSAPKAAKRTVSVPAGGINSMIDHEIYGVEALVEQLSKYPKGSTFTAGAGASPFICVFNMRKRLIGRIKAGEKPVKAPRKNKP